MTATWVSGPGRGANPGPLTPASCNLHRKKRTTGLSHTAGPGSSARRPSLALGSDADADRCNGSAVRRCAAAPGPGNASPGAAAWAMLCWEARPAGRWAVPEGATEGRTPPIGVSKNANNPAGVTDPQQRPG